MNYFEKWIPRDAKTAIWCQRFTFRFFVSINMCFCAYYIWRNFCEGKDKLSNFDCLMNMILLFSSIYLFWYFVCTVFNDTCLFFKFMLECLFQSNISAIQIIQIHAWMLVSKQYNVLLSNNSNKCIYIHFTKINHIRRKWSK